MLTSLWCYRVVKLGDKEQQQNNFNEARDTTLHGRPRGLNTMPQRLLGNNIT